MRRVHIYIIRVNLGGINVESEKPTKDVDISCMLFDYWSSMPYFFLTQFCNEDNNNDDGNDDHNVEIVGAFILSKPTSTCLLAIQQLKLIK